MSSGFNLLLIIKPLMQGIYIMYEIYILSNKNNLKF